MKKIVSILLTMVVAFSLITTNSVNIKAASSSMSVKVYQDQIMITLKSISRSGTIYGYKANSYADEDNNTGISTKDSSDFTVGTYNPSTGTNTFKVDRYDEDGYDRLYDKYYLLSSDDDIIKGPVYATSISDTKLNPESSTTQTTDTTSTAATSTSTTTRYNYEDTNTRQVVIPQVQ